MTDDFNSDLLFVCASDQIGNGEHKRIEVLFRGTEDSIIVFRHQGTIKAFRNLCVHMPRTLDCESNCVFDDQGENLRCSMHGIVYSPETGESLSEICRGKKLTPIRTTELEQRIYLNDRRVKAAR